ncbi:MAG: PepSY domain-containing protein [Gammaproteobacteria bacterium]|nr:PepSY domain-containing protein [Gammaproteobacteria bacterium]
MMNIKFSVVVVLLVTFLLLSPLRVALADDDHIEARRLLDAGEILPLEVILKNVRQTFTGRILDIELETEDQQIVYEVELLGEDGIVQEVYIDARTGKVLFTREDD